MGIGLFFHHTGTLLLLVATALLIVSDISSPVINSLTIMKVSFGNGVSLDFGSFGWCLLRSGHDAQCSSTKIGYNPASLIHDIDNTSFSTAAYDTSKALTNVMVLHAVATGLTFISFLICLGHSCVGSFIASIISAIAFIVTAVALICDFVGWSIIHHDVNNDSNGSSTADYGPAIWCVLAAGILTLIATLLVFVTCCAGRVRDKRSSRSRRNMDKYSGPAV